MEFKFIIKYQTTNRVFGINKAKQPQGFDIVLKSNMFQTCFRVWDIT